MRIISGKFKNKKLFFSKNFKTRPLKDRVRENIFNILGHSKNTNINLKNSCVLDIFAGVGSFGLECISRGAKKIFFIENDSDALLNLKKNIASLKIENQSEILANDAIKFFQDIKIDNKIDIIFLDPPFKENNIFKIIEILKEKKILNNKHIIILHRERNSQKDFLNKIKIVQNKIYGRSEIFFLKLF